jgi:hypothetical protein
MLGKGTTATVRLPLAHEKRQTGKSQG